MKFNEMKITVTFDEYILIDKLDNQKNFQATYTLDEQDVEEMLNKLDIKEEIEGYFQQIFEEDLKSNSFENQLEEK